VGRQEEVANNGRGSDGRVFAICAGAALGPGY